MGHRVPDTKWLWQPQGLQMGKKIPQFWVLNSILLLPEGSWYLPGQTMIQQNCLGSRNGFVGSGQSPGLV